MDDPSPQSRPRPEEQGSSPARAGKKLQAGHSGNASHVNPDYSTVPLFPLPNVVLFPRAVLPLHIFEERYKAMTADALRGSKLVAMALLKPGWEKNYYQKSVQIDPVVCVGEILSYEKLPDGKYNFLLQGCSRARIVRELVFDSSGPPYRVAELQTLEESPLMEIDLLEERQRLSELLSDPALAGLPGCRQFRQMFSSPLSTRDIVDLLAFNMLENVNLKQSLLSETDVRLRVRRVLQEISTFREIRRASARDANMN